MGGGELTLFEYVAVAASLVCSFTAARLLGGLTDILQAERRYWVHAAWVFSQLFGIAFGWWLFWSYREVEWNFVHFLMSLSPLAILYVLATLIIPADTRSVLSWRLHYFGIRGRFFALNLAYLVTNAINTSVLLGEPIIHPRRLLLGVMGAVFVAGLASENPKLHAVIVLVVGGVFLISSALVLRPGSLGFFP